MATNPQLPFRMPMFDGAGAPDGPELVKKLGNLTRAWVGYLGGNPNLADQVSLVANQDTTASNTQEALSVTASTQDCVVTLPPAATMQGLTKTLHLAPGSSYTASFEPCGSDTIGGGTANLILSTPGSTVMVKALGSDWVVVGSWTSGAAADARPPYPISLGAGGPATGYETPITGDAIFTLPSFGVFQDYRLGAGGGPLASVEVFANLPLAAFSDTLDAPEITSASPVTGLGGSIAGGQAVILQVFALDAASGGRFSQPSPSFSVTLPGGSGYSINFTVSWPTGAFGGKLYVAVGDTGRGLRLEADTTLPSGGSTFGTASYTLSSIAGTGAGVPDPPFDHPVYQVREEVHGGIWGALLADVGTGWLQFTGLGDTTHQATHWVGRVLSLVASPELALQDATHRIPIADFQVTGYGGSDKVTVTPDPVAAGILKGSVFVMRLQPTDPGSGFSNTVIYDPELQNPLSNSDAGLAVNAEIGNLALIIAGTGSGQPAQTIISNTLNTFTVSPGWDTAPDSTSIIVILGAAADTVPGAQALLWDYSAASPQVSVSVANEKGLTAFVELLAADLAGTTAAEELAPFREVYIWGAGVTRMVAT